MITVNKLKDEFQSYLKSQQSVSSTS